MADPIRMTVHVALFAALTAALGLIKPIYVFEVPVTAQSMGPMLAGAIAGARAGALSQVAFLALVAAGLPLLAGGRGGLPIFATPSAGYLLAWPVAALLIGWLTRASLRQFRVWRQALVHLGVSLAVIHTAGIAVWAFLLMQAGDLSLLVALATAALRDAAFLPGDIVKSTLAAIVVGVVRRGYPLANLRT